MRITLAARCLSAALLLAAAPAAAFPMGGGFSLTGGASVVSDYRFRGISLSDEDPAVQATLNLNHASGFYVGIWGSSLADTPLYGSVELDFYVGWRREVASGTTVDVGLLYYHYPGGRQAAGNSDYFEPYASLTHDFGPVTGKIGAAYAWNQGAETGGGDNVYLYTDWTAPIPESPVTLRAHLGYSDGSLSPGGDYLEWTLGADIALGPATLGISYVDTDLPSGPAVDAGIVLTLGIAF
ncbi:MAG: TorF family putative porin [Sphingomonas sp.]